MGYYYTYINGRKWYFRLVPKVGTEDQKEKKGLFSDYTKEALQDELLICVSQPNTKECSKKDKKEVHLFALFNSYLDFAKYQTMIPTDQRCFYEIILGEQAQKPHFDIDIDDSTINSDEVRDNLIAALITVLGDKKINLDLAKDLCLYTSHSTTDSPKYKRSYHLIVKSFGHQNNLEAKAFYDQVMTLIKPDWHKYIDAAVYSKVQQFRLVGSQKLGSGRIKTLCKTWSYLDKTIEHMYSDDDYREEEPAYEGILQLEESLVSFTDGCKMLPPFISANNTNKFSSNCEDSGDITKEIGLKALDLLASVANMKVQDPFFPYRYDDVTGPFVILKRVKPSMCRLCNRVHHAQNPYLLVVGEEQAVYFDCRRNAQGKKMFVGKLINEVETTTDTPTVTTEVQAQATLNIGVSWAQTQVDKIKKLQQLSEQSMLTPDAPKELTAQRQQELFKGFMNRFMKK